MRKTFALDKFNQQMLDLVPLAIAAIKGSLSSESPHARLQAATTILINAEVLKPGTKTVRHDNKLLIVWNDDKNGNKNPILSAPKASGDTRVTGAI